MAWHRVLDGSVIVMDFLKTLHNTRDINRDRSCPLFEAARTGDKENLQRFLQDRDIDAYQKDRFGQTALMIAASENHVDCVKCLLDANKTEDINEQDNSGNTALMAASYKGHYECVKCLVETTLADVNLLNFEKTSALMLAAKNGHSACVKYLLNFVDLAYTNVEDKKTRTALILASQGGHSECVKYLIDKGRADVNSSDYFGYTALTEAAERGYSEIVKTLAEVEGIDVNRKIFGKTALMLASREGHFDCVKCLIETELTCVNLCDEDRYTALMHAAERGFVEIVKTLTEVEEIDVNRKSILGKTALMLASWKGHLDCVKCLIETGLTDVNLCDKDRYTALMHAAERGFVEIVKTLTEVEEIALNISGLTFERTALMLASWGGHLECVKSLIETGLTYVNLCDKDKNTALMLAAERGYYEIVELLAKVEGIAVNIINNKGQTALMCASFKGHTLCFEALFSSSSKVEVNVHDNEGRTALILAIWSSRSKLECVKCLIGHKNVNVWERDNEGKTAFMLAAEESNDWFLRCFLDITTTELTDGGEKQDQRGEIFTTVLSPQNPEASIRYLPGITWRNPYIYQRDQNEESVVNLVIRNGLRQCLTCFLLAYSDVPISENHPCSHSLLDNTETSEYDIYGNTPLMSAARNRNSECIEYLIQFQRIRLHLLVMLMQNEFFEFGTVSIVFFKRLCSLVSNYTSIDQFMCMMCNGVKIGKCVDYLLSDHICQMNSSGYSAFTFLSEDITWKGIEPTLLLQHVSHRNHLLVDVKRFFLKNPSDVSNDVILELVKVGFFHWEWYPDIHELESAYLITRELVARDIAPGLFKWHGKQSSPLYHAFMSWDNELVRYMMANLYMTPSDLECFQGDTHERECLRQIESEDIQQIYREHFTAPWRLENLSLLSLSNWLRKNKGQRDVDKVLDALPKRFQSRLPFRNPMRMILPCQWDTINLDFLNQRLSASLSEDDLTHHEYCDGFCLQIEKRDLNLDMDMGIYSGWCNDNHPDLLEDFDLDYDSWLVE